MTEPAPDSRYAQTVEKYLVCEWDKYAQPVLVAATRELAEQYIAGQWSDEGYSIQTIQELRALPERRTLYLLHGRLPYAAELEPTRQRQEDLEFPGLGNGDIVSLGQTTSSVKERIPHGWDVFVASWDRDAAETAFEAAMTEADARRTALRQTFSRFPTGCAVRTRDGRTLIRVSEKGIAFWRSASNQVIHDVDLTPAELTLLTLPPDADPAGEHA
ncbi:hypothetical protein [Nonomuraea sp. NPDC049695]|uniref:hypothetical protein n=1 Tax=Nonomuraea sp. NPDC049695 TaxID=3154734 RepID=UPI00342E1585